MFSRTTDYALRAMLVLAKAYGHRPVHADDIASATGSPRNYLSKVLNALGKEGVVRSTRGPAGGFSLAREPGSITVAQLLDVFEREHVHKRCLLGTSACDPARPCAAHHRWSAVLAAQRAPLESTTLADLVTPLGGPHHPSLPNTGTLPSS